MEEGPGKLEAVRLARERLGEVNPEKMVEFIRAEFGLSLPAVAVKVLLASLRERELREANWQRLQSQLQAALAEQANLRKGRRKGSKRQPDQPTSGDAGG